MMSSNFGDYFISRNYYFFDYFFDIGVFSIFLFIVLAIVVYIFKALAVQTIAKRHDLPNTWLAWIPIANLYLFASLIKEKVKIPYFEWSLVVGPSLIVIATASPFLQALLAIAMHLIILLIFYELFKKYSESYVLMTIFGIIFPILLPFFLFSIRNNKVVD